MTKTKRTNTPPLAEETNEPLQTTSHLMRSCAYPGAERSGWADQEYPVQNASDNIPLAAPTERALETPVERPPDRTPAVPAALLIRAPGSWKAVQGSYAAAE